MGVVQENVAAVRRRVAAACERAGRDPDEIRVVAVSKGVPVERIRDAVDAGVTDVGENRAQELRDKVRTVGDLGEGVRWHYVGSIQTNKVRYLGSVSVIHSVDRAKEARALQRRAEKDDRRWDVLVEVNVAEESQKQGVAPDALGSLLREVRSCSRLRVRGLMIVAPRVENPEDVRWVFADARELRDRYRESRDDLEELSMGMTDDFEIAVEEGATLVRIGRAIFREG